jgi:AcrR family transcriptional regulator
MPDFTRRAIMIAFMDLLEQKPLSQITVKNITDVCGINRNSFYYHFRDIPTLLEEIVAEQAKTIISAYPTIDSVEKCLEVAVQFGLDHRQAVLHIFNSVNWNVYERNLMDVCHYVVSTYVDTVSAGHPLRPGDREILVMAYQCECFGQVVDWVNNGMKEDIVIPFRRLCELRHGMVEEVLRRSEEN